MDDTQWPMTLEDFRELKDHLAAKLPRVHTSLQWQWTIYYFKEIERELKEWKRLEGLERDAMEAYHRVMEL